MSYPHDYYGPHHGPHDPNDPPHLHNRGEGRTYLEYDYHANDHGPQLPAISTIGRGPRGEGLTVGNVVNEDGTVSFALYSDLTGELVWQSPNLAPGTLDFYPTDFRDLSAGQPAPMDIVYTKGGVTKTTTAYLPCGERGSLVFLLGGRSIPRVPSDTYQTTAEELMIYGHRTWPNDNKPLPHVNDIVFFRYTDGDETGFAFGTIETVGTRNNENTVPSTPIVYTARVFVPCTGGGTAEPLIVEASWRTRGKSVNDEYELVCEETAGVMYEAFTAGRKVLLHATNTPSTTRGIATHEDYYEVVDAMANNVDIAESTKKGNVITDYLFFTASLPNLNGPDNLEQPYVLARSNDCLENECPILYPRRQSYAPLIVETHTDIIPDTSAQRSVNTKSHPANIALYCEETAGVMFDAFTSGRPVLLRVYADNDTKQQPVSTGYLKVVSAETEADSFAFVVVDLHGGATGRTPTAMGSYNANSPEDYPYFAQPTNEDTSPFVIALTEEIVGDETRYVFDKTASEVFHAYVDTNAKVIFDYYNEGLDRTGYYNLTGMRIDNANDKYFFEIDAGFAVETSINDVWSIETASNGYPYFNNLR